LLSLQPYAGQHPRGDYPGGKGTPQDVENARKAIDQIPGIPGRAAQGAFDEFDQNYQTRVAENKLPASLSMTDVSDAVNKAATNWQLHYDVDLYLKEQHGPFGVRDLRPNTDVAPGGGKLPRNFFAVGLDSAGRPVDVLNYSDLGSGTRYQSQYQFRYDALSAADNSPIIPDGGRRVTVQNWVDGETNNDRLSGPKQVIGNRENILAGVTQYYYDASGHCVEALYFRGSEFLKAPGQRRPIEDMKFPQGLADQSIEERTRASRIDFFDLLGPRLTQAPKL
jgi:hypothetical protein